MTIEETVQNALRGQLSEATRLPAPKLIKIYISGRKRGNFIMFLLLGHGTNGSRIEMQLISQIPEQNPCDTRDHFKQKHDQE